MALRANWEGYLRLNLISVPVRAYSATVTNRGKIGFHQIHKACNSRIRYQKVCPIHGPVTKDEIVSGYEYAKGEYILIDPKELDKLRTENDKAINIETFIHPEALDPMYFTERSYFLLPSGKAANKSFAVLRQVMADEERYAIAQVVFAGREQLVAVRAAGKLLVMTMLSYQDQLKKPETFEEEVPDVEVPAKERKLAQSLVEASTAEQFDFGQFRDNYTSHLRKLIEAKASGKKIVAPPATEEPQIINLMEALRKSLDTAERQHSHAKGKPKAGKSVSRGPKPRKTG